MAISVYFSILWFLNPTRACLCAEQRKLPMQRATYEYLRGKILDVFPYYRKEAEDHLSKAVSKIKL